ncbi:MAG TPA: hypothetical protein PLY86_18575 [bacterium]|nr:hypothetical protein [bacterium]
MFQRITVDICQQCQKEEDEELRDAQEYLRSHPRASIYDLVDELEIEQPLIGRWVEEGRLALIKDLEEEANTPRCASCGREIKEGETYCRTCLFKRLQGKGAQRKTEPDKEQAPEKPQTRVSGMHFKIRED